MMAGQTDRQGSIPPRKYLRRKFAAPAQASSYVRETVLTEKVLALDGWKTCLLSAGLGYGKTSLAAQWHEEINALDGAMALWITLDEHDGDPLYFLGSLSVAFQAVDDAFAESAEGRSACEGDGDVSVEDCAIDLINAIDRHCDSECDYVLILDDYDKAASAEFDALFSFLHRYCPQNVHLLLLGSSFSLELEDLFLDSSVMEIRSSDLAFPVERMREFAFGLIPEMDQEEFGIVSGLAQGWPLTFAFYQVVRRRYGRIDSASRKYLIDYSNRFFERNVFGSLKEEVSEFLIETSLLDDLSPELCDRVTGKQNGQFMLRELSRRNLFVSFDHSGGCYRHHRLFRLFLLEKLLSFKADYIAKLSRRACLWLADHGERGQVLKYLALSCDPYFLEISVLGSTGMELPPDYDSPLEYLLASPAERFVQDAYSVWIAIWATISAGQVRMARDCIETLKEILDRDKGEASNYRYAEAICVALEGDSARSLELIDETLTQEGSDVSTSFQCLLLHMKGEDFERLGEVGKAHDTYLKSLALAERETTPFYRLFDRYLLAHYSISMGWYDDAVNYASLMLKEAREESPLYGEACTIFAYVYLAHGDVEQSEKYVKRALERVNPGANIDMYVDTQVMHARLLQARGETIPAMAVLDAVLKDIEGSRVPRNLQIEACALKVALAASTKDMPSAVSCEYLLDAFEGNPDTFRMILCLQAKATLCFMRGESDRALQLLDDARSKARACESSHSLAEIGVLRACINADVGRSDAAMIELAKSVELAMKNGDVGAFSRGGLSARNLLVKLATSRKTSSAIRAFARSVLDSVAGGGDVGKELASAEGAVTGFYSLTEREREILNCLNSGMSRAEIGEALSVSQNTVKSHLKNIYSKLGVHSRAEAYKAIPD